VFHAEKQKGTKPMATQEKQPMATQEKTLADAFYETLKDVFYAEKQSERGPGPKLKPDRFAISRQRSKGDRRKRNIARLSGAVR
jgi:hypothetical protein